MSESYVFQLNVKGDEGYDAPLVNITGASQEEFEANCRFVSEHASDVMATATALQAAYKLLKPSPEPKGSGGRNNSWGNKGSQQSSQQAPPEDVGPAPRCRHGEMKYVPAGFSTRTKKNYGAFWACEGPREEQCDSQSA
jgi:hypothetical protein